MIEQYGYGICECKSTKPNVIDFYQNWRAEDIRADLDARRTGIVMICENIGYNINIGCVVRSNNAFLGNSVYITGRRRVDTRSAVGCGHYEHVYHADTSIEVIEHLHKQEYVVYAVDNIEEYHPMNVMDVAYSFPYKSAFVFGNEGVGLLPETIDACDEMVYINQMGSVRSLNVAQAAAIIEYEYSRAHYGENLEN